MRFTEPFYLLLFIPILAGLYWSFSQVHGMARSRKRFAFFVRFVLAGLLVFALSGPEARRPNKGVCTVFLLDRSDSIGETDRHRQETFVDQALQKLGADDAAGVIAFGKGATIDSAPGGRRSLGRVLSTTDGSSSDLAGAVRLASATFPEGKGRRIVILSDGNETSGDAAEAAQVAATDGIVIDHVPLGLGDRQGEASVVSVEGPDETRIDQPFDLRVIVDSTTEQNATVDVDRDGILLKRITSHLNPGRNSVVVGEKIKDVGFHRYRATLHASQDLDNRNNVGMSFVAVRGKPRILVLQQNRAKSELAEALRKNGLVVDLGDRGSMPTHPEDLQPYDGIIFNDVNADAFTQSQMKMVQSTVRDSGVGFAMIGGENSYLPGGYYGTPIAELLPVDLNIRQRKTFPSTSVCIMADTSGSMGMPEDGIPKVRLAAKAAEETVKMMSPMDRVGVAGSTDGIEFVAPMQKLVDKTAVINQIEKLNVGGGGIYIRPSMEKGEEVLMKESTQVRHFILLADGSDADEQGGALEIALRMRANKITTSVVAIGDGKDVAFLKQLGMAGGGRFYLAKKASQLPAIFTQDASIMSRSAIEEGAFIPKMTIGEPVLRGIDATPPLLAYDLTDTRPLARVGMRTKKDDPLLATWQYGLGTSMAFTSDAQSRWASNWVGWQGFGAFWSQAARQISRRATLNNYQVSVRQDGGKGIVDVKAFDRRGEPMNATNASVRVATPNGGSRDVSLAQEGPGSYSGKFDASELGTYIVTVNEPDPAGGTRASSSGFSIPYPPEYRSFRANRPLLERVSAMTGGMLLQKPLDALRAIKNPGESITELWPLLLLCAAVLLPFDVGVRRIALPLGEILAKIFAKFKDSRVPKVSAQPVVVGRLQQAKQRAQREVSTDAPSEPVIVSRPSEPREPVAPAASSTPSGSTNRLLDAKRKRKE